MKQSRRIALISAVTLLAVVGPLVLLRQIIVFRDQKAISDFSRRTGWYPQDRVITFIDSGITLKLRDDEVLLPTQGRQMAVRSPVGRIEHTVGPPEALNWRSTERESRERVALQTDFIRSLGLEIHNVKPYRLKFGTTLVYRYVLSVNSGNSRAQLGVFDFGEVEGYLVPVFSELPSSELTTDTASAYWLWRRLSKTKSIR